MDIRHLDQCVSVSGQIAASDMAALAAQGFAMIVNNRPDGEAPGQPSSDEMARAAGAAGIGYRYIPVRGLAASQVAEMVEVLEEAQGPVLAFCASGTRSSFLWALARASAGEDPVGLVLAAQAAGYDLSPIRAFLG